MQDVNKTTFYKIIDSIEDMMGNAFVLITAKDEDITWVTKGIAAFLGVEEGTHKNFYNELETYCHPQDLEEYKQGIAKKISGEDLRGELYIRFRTNEKYCLLGITAEEIHEGEKDYLLMTFKNYNVGPEVDYITDLYGRPRFLEDLQLYISEKRSISILMVELSHIEELNMLYGQTGGDYVYQMVALHFIYMMTMDTAVYRVNETGFVFILKNYNRKDTEEFAAQVRDYLKEEVYFEEMHLEIMSRMSALLVDDFNIKADTIQGKLEYLLNLPKDKNNAEIIFFNDMISYNNVSNQDIIRLVHQSVLHQCDGFYVEYQPIVDAQTGAVAGAEALVRWKKEPFGFVPPGMFIEWMENNPSMYTLGNFVLDTAVRDAAMFMQHKSDFYINVNISCKQLERMEFRNVVLQTLEKYHFPAGNLCLELTERCKDIPLEVLREHIMFFQKHGIRVALDDYGTGSASAALALQLPVNEIKLDMSFIRGIMDNPKQQALVKNILQFASEAGMESCVEGVEDEALQNFLRQYAATWFQGYYYSKPVAADVLVRTMLP